MLKYAPFSAAVLFGWAAAQELYKSGEIKTQERFLYGRFATRMQGSNKKGTVGSFFTFWEGDSSTPWNIQHWEEIDVEIVPSVTDAPFSTNIIYAWQQMDTEKIYNFDPADNWHTYQIDWTPNYIAWSLDGVEVRREAGTASQQDINKATALFMNFWTPTFAGWGDNMDDPATMPWYTRYDWVEVYDYDAQNDDFVLRWRDDFDGLNLERWRVSNNWSFDQNSTRFMNTQTYVEDGSLVLKMEDINSVPPVDNATYVYTNRCGASDDRSLCLDCSTGQACQMSYPFGDKQKTRSPDAACRCLPRQRAPHGYTFETRNKKQVQNGTCDGCKDCAASYPKDDPTMFKSAETMLRCKADSAETFVYGWNLHCGAKYDQDCGADCMFCLWSYPQGDPAGFDSSNARCRCPPEQIKELTWGDRCPANNSGDCGGYCRDCQYSWKTYEEAANIGNNSLATCRCKNWW